MVRVLLSLRMLPLHAAVVVAVLAAGLLGRWQYHAWEAGRTDRTTAVVRSDPKPLDALMTSDSAFPRTGVGAPVALTGRWLPRDTFFVSGRELRGRTGFWAVTPVAVCSVPDRCDRAPAMLVVRGWTRTVGGAPAAPSGAVRVTGWLQPGESDTADDADPGDDVYPQLRVVDVLSRVDHDLYGAYVIARTATATATPPATSTAPTGGTAGSGTATASEVAGLQAVTPAALPAPSTFTSVRNLLYALEWWFFGGFAVYVWARWCRDEVGRVTGVPSPG